ncbi:MAG: hypothetical protein M5R40_06895 [Anaerolineae bacterium]|nr:hypothetical protein [Anaerolineae bacterium]
MIYWFLMHGLQLILDLFALSRLSDRDKDAEILLLRYQLRLATRDCKRGPTLPFWHKLPLAVLVNWLLRGTSRARQTLAHDALLFTPDTLIRWHRACPTQMDA